MTRIAGILTALLLALALATPGYAAFVFSAGDVQIDPTTDGTTGSFNITVDVSGGSTLSTLTLEMALIPSSGMVLTGATTPFAGGFNLTPGGVNFLDNAGGNYRLSSAGITNVGLVAGSQVVYTVNVALVSTDAVTYGLGLTVKDLGSGTFPIYTDITSQGSVASTGSITVAPEPASLALLGLGSLLIVRRKRAA
jgi:hypothetical protein